MRFQSSRNCINRTRSAVTFKNLSLSDSSFGSNRAKNARGLYHLLTNHFGKHSRYSHNLKSFDTLEWVARVVHWRFLEVFMTQASFYDYLRRSRFDLFAFLRSMPDDAISRDVIPGKRFHSIKDLVIHIAVVEDSWIHEDILKDQPVWENTKGFPSDFEKAYHASDSLEWMLEYWLSVQNSTLTYLEKLEVSTLTSELSIETQDGFKIFTVAEIIWHVMQHEVRHTAQIMLLARQLGFDPPQLDLIRYAGRLET